MRISDWSSDVCSSDLAGRPCPVGIRAGQTIRRLAHDREQGVTRASGRRRSRPASRQRLVYCRAKADRHMIEIRNIADEIRTRGHYYRARFIPNEANAAKSENAPLPEVPALPKNGR